MTTSLDNPLSDARKKNAFERALTVFTDVRPGEGTTVLLMALNIFLVLLAYYIIKPVREALILSAPRGAEFTHRSDRRSCF